MAPLFHNMRAAIDQAIYENKSAVWSGTSGERSWDHVALPPVSDAESTHRHDLLIEHCGTPRLYADVVAASETAQSKRNAVVREEQECSQVVASWTKRTANQDMEELLRLPL